MCGLPGYYVSFLVVPFQEVGLTGYGFYQYTYMYYIHWQLFSCSLSVRTFQQVDSCLNVQFTLKIESGNRACQYFAREILYMNMCLCFFNYFRISISVFHLGGIVNIRVLCEISGKPILVRISLYLLGQMSQTHMYSKVKFDMFVGQSVTTYEMRFLYVSID